MSRRDEGGERGPAIGSLGMSAVFTALVPVFLLIALGFGARRVLVPDEAHWIGLQRLVYFILFPALLVETLTRADLTSVPVIGVGGALLAAVLLMSVICLALRPFLVARWAIDGPAFTSVFQGATRWQTYVALAPAGVVAMIPLLNVLNVLGAHKSQGSSSNL